MSSSNRKMFSSSFVVILLANYCILGNIAAEIEKDGSIQIEGKSLIVDPVADLNWLHSVPALKEKPNAKHILNHNLEMVASENEPVLNSRLPLGKRRLDEDPSPEASFGHSRGSYIRAGHDNQNQVRRGGRSKGNNVGYDDQVTDTNNHNRRSLMNNNNGKNEHRPSNQNRKAVAESRKSSSRPYAARQEDGTNRDDIFDDDDDSDDNRAKRRSDSDDSIFRDDDDENESSSQDGSSRGYRGRSNLRTAAADANARNFLHGGKSMHRNVGGRNSNGLSSSLNDDDGGNSEDEDIDSTNLAKQKVLPAKEAKKEHKNQQRKQVKNRTERAHQVTERKKKFHEKRNNDDVDNSRSLHSASDNSKSKNNNQDYNGSYSELEDDTSANSQHVSQSSGDLQTAAGHHHGKSHGKYYQYAGQPKKKAYKWGFKRGNHKHEIEGHGKGYKNKFHGSFKWHAKEKCGKKKKKKCKSMGKMTWEYKHHDKKKKKHHHY